MKNLKIVITALLLFAVLVGIGIAAIPPPPANQNLGIYDSAVANLTQTQCKNAACHGTDDTAIANRHHLLVPSGEWNCQNCHPVDPGAPGGYGVVMERNCVQCHNGTEWSGNPSEVNISRPHHINTADATNRQCDACHGSLIANYDDLHVVPSYNTSLVTPLADYKIFNTTSLRYWGGCQACHDADTAADPDILDNHDTHHGAILGDRFGVGHQKDRTAGMQCTWCHVGNTSAPARSDGSGQPYLQIYLTDPGFGWDTVNKHMELRNSTLLNLGDTVNGTGCQKCHSVASIHNIQVDYVNGGTAGKGHINNNWDCNGCHAFWDAGAAPYVGAIIPGVTSITPSKLTEGAATVVTITGSDFLSGSGTYTAAVSVDGSTITPDSVTANQIVVTVPALTAGVHTIQVVKNGDVEPKYSGLSTLVVTGPTDVVSAALSGSQITVVGTGFGGQPDNAFASLGVFIDHTTGKGKNKVTTTIEATIVSWTDTEIVATADVSSGDPLTVKSLNGQDTVTIGSGGPPTDPTPTPTRTPKPPKH